MRITAFFFVSTYFYLNEPNLTRVGMYVKLDFQCKIRYNREHFAVAA